MKPATAAVLALLRERPEGLTALECLRADAGDSLAQRVHELREAGYAIPDEFEETDKGARVKRYRLSDQVLIRAGAPVGRLRLCPSCRTEHHAGTTCLFPIASGSHPGAAPASPLGTGVRVASERLPAGPTG